MDIVCDGYISDWRPVTSASAADGQRGHALEEEEDEDEEEEAAWRVETLPPDSVIRRPFVFRALMFGSFASGSDHLIYFLRSALEFERLRLPPTPMTSQGS